MISIVTVNYFLEHKDILNISIHSKDTILDADVVIIDTSMVFSPWNENIKNSNNGKNYLISPFSDELVKSFNRRKDEINTLLGNGKIVICLSSEFDTLDLQIEGSTKHRTISNYSFIEGIEESFSSSLYSGKGYGHSIREVKRNMFSPYYYAFKNELTYSVYYEDDILEDNIILVNKADKPVGFNLYFQDGLISFLPKIVRKDGDDTKIVNVIVRCTKNYFENYETTPPPNWIENFALNGEGELNTEINNFISKIEELEAEKTKIIEQREKLIKYKSLLYEQGHELEACVIDAFKLMGFEASNRQLNDLEHDIVFDSKEGRGLAELEGKDDNAINISKLDQLNRAIDEDFHLTGDYPQGILIGNHYRLKDPRKREYPFTDKVKIVAQKKSYGLLTTYEIYKAVKSIVEDPNNINLKESYRKKILETTGEIIELVDVEE